jgi:uncharacterized membrane protein YeaQ/YmgE (transglycosylase-associated protein family)
MRVLLFIIVIGFIAGVIARVLVPGPNTPRGFVLTTLLGIAGALLATFLGHAFGIYHAYQGAGVVGATVGAVLILYVWRRLVAKGVIPDHGL